MKSPFEKPTGEWVNWGFDKALKNKIVHISIYSFTVYNFSKYT